MPHHDRELTDEKLVYNLYLPIMKFNYQKSIPALSTFLTVYLYSKLVFLHKCIAFDSVTFVSNSAILVCEIC
jgi:hypothetical protein